MSGGPPHHSHGRQAPPSNAAAWNRLQVPNYFPRQPQLAHMSNEHPLLHQPTWHTPTTEPMKTIPHPHIFNLEQMLSERSYPRSGVDLTLTRNGSQNGDLPTAPISLSVRDTNKINSLPASALEIQAVELKTPVMKSGSPGLKSSSPGVKPLSPAISTSPGLMERQGSPKNTKKPKRMDSILERLNSQPPQSENPAEKIILDLPITEKSIEKIVQPIQSVIVQPSNSIHDENSNSSGILNIPTPTNLREDEVTSPYSNDDSLDSNKSRRKRKPSKTIRLTKESEKTPDVAEDPLKLDTVVKDATITNPSELHQVIPAESAKSGDEANEFQRQRSNSPSSESSPAAKKTRRKTSSESETIAKIAAMVQEVVKETSMESQKVDKSENKSVSVSVIKDTTVVKQSSTIPQGESTENNEKSDENPINIVSELSSSTIVTPAQRKATNFVEVENKLEEMFAGIEESSTTPKVDPLEIDCEKMDDFMNDKDEIDSRFDLPSTSQNDVSSTSNDLISVGTSPKKTRPPRRKSSKLNSSYEKKKKAKKGKESTKSKNAKKAKKSVNGKQIKVDVIKDIYAYDSGSNTSSVKSKGPFIQIRGPRDSPISVSIVNTAVEDDTEKKTTKSSKKFHDDSEYRHKVRSKGLHCSTLSNKYDAQTKDVSWICVFCKRGPHSTDPNVLGPSIFNAQVLPPGDLFGPYVVTSNCPEYERRMDDPYDKQFKSKKIARGLDATTNIQQIKVSGKKSKRKHSESDRSINDLDSSDINLGITETGDKTFEIWVHEDCVVWAPGVYLVGPKIIGLEEAVWTSCNVSCTRCGFKGANICCLRRGCTNVMHFGCAAVSNWQLNFEDYTALCITHKSV